MEMETTEEEIEFENEKDLAELCHHNGISYSAFSNTPDRVQHLDMFLGYWQKMRAVRYFSRLVELTIIQQPNVKFIDGLENCTLLERCWIVECSLESMVGLEKCVLLKLVNLSRNKIRKMEGLSGLIQLETLWLNENEIINVSGLEELKELKEVWLCGNRISEIGNGFDGNRKLERIHLAKNRIGNIKQVIQLNRLERLEMLSFGDPHFGDSPICALCNYRIYVICQLPNLKYLDAKGINSEQQQAAETTFMKKKMYYNMRVKALHRNMDNIEKRLKGAQKKQIQRILDRIYPVVVERNRIEKEMQELQWMGKSSNPNANYDGTMLMKKKQNFDVLIDVHYDAIEKEEKRFIELQNVLNAMADTNRARLYLELDTGGNIRLEDGKPSDIWFTSCQDLIKSRVSNSKLQEYGIKDIKVNRVTRIHNRFLKNRFNHAVKQILFPNHKQVLPSKTSVSKTGATSKKGIKPSDTTETKAPIVQDTLEYLFHVGNPKFDMDDTRKETYYVAECGFQSPQMYDAAGLDAAVPLSNSFSIAEIPKLAATMHKRGCEIRKTNPDWSKLSHLNNAGWQTNADKLTAEMKIAKLAMGTNEWELPPCVVIVSKAFIGTNKNYTLKEKLAAKIAPSDSEEFHTITVQDAHEDKDAMYYSLNEDFVVPEYIIEYEFVSLYSKSSVPEVPPTLTEVLLDTESLLPQDKVGFKIAQQEKEDMGPVESQLLKYNECSKIQAVKFENLAVESTDGTISMDCSNVSSMRPVLKEQVFVPTITMDTLQAYGVSDDLSKIVYLNLTNNGITCIQNLHTCINLEILILSCNEIQEVSGIETCANLKRVDLGYNNIQLVSGLENLHQLATLQLNNNKIQSFKCLANINKQVPNIQQVDLRHNPVCQIRGYELVVLEKLDKLTQIDGRSVTSEEKSIAKEYVSEITANKIRKHSTWNASEYVRKDNDLVDWKSIEEINFNHCGLSKIQNLDKIINLKRASFSDNEISHIAGFESCTYLEELNLESNRVCSMQGLTSMTSLRKLDLGKNLISNISSLTSLTHLTQLSLENNNISCLSGLHSLKKLMELYIGNNKIEQSKEIQKLKLIPNLIILDISGNPLCADETFYYYTIYYLRKIKVLNGTSVTAQQIAEAKSKYSGKLTTEFLIEKIGEQHPRVQDLELSSCRIREIESLHGDKFLCLKELNLEHNFIVDVGGLNKLPNLHILRLSHNKIERLSDPQQPDSTNSSNSRCSETECGMFACPNLEILEIANNRIVQMNELGLHALKKLKILRLESNSIRQINGLSGNDNLRELNLKRNKIKSLDEKSTMTLVNLKTFYLDDNGMKQLNNFKNLFSLEYLSLSGNRIVDAEETDKLLCIPQLKNLNLHSNPISKNQLYRPKLLHKFTQLKILDTKEVNLEERERVQMIFSAVSGQQASQENARRLSAGVGETRPLDKNAGQLGVSVNCINQAVNFLDTRSQQFSTVSVNRGSDISIGFGNNTISALRANKSLRPDLSQSMLFGAQQQRLNGRTVSLAGESIRTVGSPALSSGGRRIVNQKTLNASAGQARLSRGSRRG